MSTRVVDRVDEWPDEPFSDGYRQLQDLADEEFSGAVRAAGAQLYMTKGTVVGILGGDIEDFEDATGTVHEAPSPALPLLAVMQEHNDEVRAKYYTEKTAIHEVDETLSDGGFTGYVELSENVLSGDYYLVYHGGRSMSAAYVGNRPEFLDGQEAFDRADGEVGIYEVRPAEVEQIEIPEPVAADPTPDDPAPAGDSVGAETADTGGDGTGTGDEAGGTDERDGESGETDEQSNDTAVRDEEESSSRSTGTAQQQSAGPDVSTAREPTEERAETADRSQRAAQQSATTSDPSQQVEESDAQTGTQATEQAASTDQTHTETPQQPPTQREQGAVKGRPGEETQSSQRGTATSQSDQERRRKPSTGRETASGRTSSSTTELETRAVPSLDPERTKESDDNGARGDSPGSRETDRQEAKPPKYTQSQTETQQVSGQRRRQAEQAQESQRQRVQPQEAQASDSQETTPESGTDDTTTSTDAIEELETELEKRESEIERLESELETADGERDDLQAELESVRSERDELDAEVERLEEEVDRLEADLNRLETEFGAATDAERRMTASEALDGTDLFVRYHSKGDATLEKAHNGSVRREDVTENLRLEKHTQFDASSVAIGDREYSEFLESTAEFQFVKWLVHDLLFEIRDTNYTKELKDIFDALPQVDRAELSGAVDVVYSDDGQETRSTERFDVVLRDRMGNPLLVANLNDSREAATQSMMEGLITAAERVGQTTDGFSGAFLVTQSFFEPGALETASEATKDGLLSRDKRKSFVNLSRKTGYHLCLVEARNADHHLAVPEL